MRDFAESDVEWCTDLLVGWDPSFPAESYRRVLTGEGARLIRLRVAELDGEPVGVGCVAEFEGVPRPLVSVVVTPTVRGRGVGSALFADVWPTVPDGLATAGMPDHDERSLAVARHWGFEVLGHGVESVLALTDEPVVPALPAGVLEVHVGAESAAASRELDAFLAEVGDYPESADYGNSMSTSVVLQVAPRAVWVVLFDDVGTLAATVIDPREGGEWYVVFTATAPRARGTGMGRAVKQAAHRLAYEQGARAVRTTNEARNERMRALNAALGYVRVGGDIRLARG